MRTHVKVPPGRTSAPRAERARATEASATMGRIAPTATTARKDLPTHELGRMTGGGRLAAKPDQDREAEAIPNNTGLPDRLKAGVEKLSGFAMDDVRVHFNSSKPAALQAFAYTQGNEIHVGPGQQRYLPHEAWHVAQQKQGRVKSTLLMKGKAISDDGALEREADHFGRNADSAVARRLQWPAAGFAGTMRSSVIQRAPFVTIDDKPVDLGGLSIAQLQALLKTTLNTSALQAIDEQIRTLQESKYSKEDAAGGQPATSAVLQPGVTADKKDTSDNTPTNNTATTPATAASLGAQSISITVGTRDARYGHQETTLRFVQVSPSFSKKANLILEQMSRNWMIHEFLGGRTCSISLKLLERTPAEISESKELVSIDLATWYFERYDLGYIMGMLAHELGIHPMANKNPRVKAEEKAQNAKSVVPLSAGQQRDHLVGAVWNSERNKVYRKLALEMAIQLAEAATKTNSGIPPGEATKLIDSFIMDCVSINVSGDHRVKAAKAPQLLAKEYNIYKKRLEDLVKSRESLSEEASVSNALLLEAFPADKTLFNILAEYGKIYWNFQRGKQSTASLDAPSSTSDTPNAETKEKSSAKAKPQPKSKKGPAGDNLGDIELIDLWKH
jgi:hypothetical protein